MGVNYSTFHGPGTVYSCMTTKLIQSIHHDKAQYEMKQMEINLYFYRLYLSFLLMPIKKTKQSDEVLEKGSRHLNKLSWKHKILYYSMYIHYTEIQP